MCTCMYVLVGCVETNKQTNKNRNHRTGNKNPKVTESNQARPSQAELGQVGPRNQAKGSGWVWMWVLQERGAGFSNSSRTKLKNRRTNLLLCLLRLCRRCWLL